MGKIVSEDALRRALARMSAEQSQSWLRPRLLLSVQAALDTPWILDINTTVKTLFGQQSGAEVSYNPHKPGRPSPTSASHCVLKTARRCSRLKTMAQASIPRSALTSSSGA
jgi:hypothetical protein